MIPDVYASLDGRSVKLGASSRSISEGGYHEAEGLLKEADARRAEQGSVLKIFGDDGSTRWEGTMAANPLVVDGVAVIKAAGYKLRAEKAKGRQLYMTRDLGNFQDSADPPLNFLQGAVNNSDDIDVTVDGGALLYRPQPGENQSVDENHGMAMWARGSPGGITSYAFTMRTNVTHAVIGIRSRTFTGPAASITNELLHPVDVSSKTVDRTITTPQDGLELRYDASSGGGGAFTARVIRLTNTRIRGIATSDTMTTSAIVRDIGTRLGFDVSGVQESGVNGLPFDIIDESRLDALFYMAYLTDWQVRILDDRGSGPYMEFSPFNTEHVVSLAKDAAPDLTSQELFNRFVVKYPTEAGWENEVVVDASPDPLAGTGQALTAHPNIYELVLTDVQADDTFATSLANAHAAHFSQQRLAGTLDVVNFQGLPGDLVTISDFGPAESVSLRCTGVESTPGEPDHLTVETSPMFLGAIGRGELIPDKAEKFPWKKERRQAKKFRKPYNKARRERFRELHAKGKHAKARRYWRQSRLD